MRIVGLSKYELASKVKKAIEREYENFQVEELKKWLAWFDKNEKKIKLEKLEDERSVYSVAIDSHPLMNQKIYGIQLWQRTIKKNEIIWLKNICMSSNIYCNNQFTTILRV